MNNNSENNDWNVWSKYVLRELERLNEELKNLKQYFDGMTGHTIENEQASKAINDKLVSISKRVDDLVTDFKETNTTISDMKVSIAEKMAWGSLGGGIITLAIKLLEFFIKK